MYRSTILHSNIDIYPKGSLKEINHLLDEEIFVCQFIYRVFNQYRKENVSIRDNIT
uniref:Uncharacterized protein n=1 Tax=Lepeophtheirus salmonis TaxID=72036 RepID=A0A0K2VLP8_LEPSM